MDLVVVTALRRAGGSGWQLLLSAGAGLMSYGSHLAALRRGTGGASSRLVAEATLTARDDETDATTAALLHVLDAITAHEGESNESGGYGRTVASSCPGSPKADQHAHSGVFPAAQLSPAARARPRLEPLALHQDAAGVPVKSEAARSRPLYEFDDDDGSRRARRAAPLD